MIRRFDNIGFRYPIVGVEDDGFYYSPIIITQDEGASLADIIPVETQGGG